MAYQLSALCDRPENPEAFDRHYRELPAPLAAKAPGLTSYPMSFCAPGPDGSQPPYHLIANLTWADKDALGAALASPEFKAAADDLSNFAAGGVRLVFSEVETVV